jgi:hypothetical protein
VQNLVQHAQFVIWKERLSPRIINEIIMVVIVLISHIVAQVGVLVLLKHLKIKHDAGMRPNSFGHYVFLTISSLSIIFPVDASLCWFLKEVFECLSKSFQISLDFKYA